MSGVKAPGPTGELPLKLRSSSGAGGSGTLGGAVKCVDIEGNVGGEGDSLCFY
jgi:hypothetical protein